MRRATVIAAALLIAVPCAGPAQAAKETAMQTRETSAAMDFLAALGRLDFDGAGSFLDDAAVLDLPFAGKGLTLSGRENVLQFFRKTMTASVGAIEYRLERAYPSPEAGATVLEVSTQARTAAGEAYTNRLVTIFEFRDGKIALFREYFNPAPLAR